MFRESRRLSFASAVFIVLSHSPAAAITIDSAILSVTWDGRTSTIDVKNRITTVLRRKISFSDPTVFGTDVPDWASGAFAIADDETAEEATLTKGIQVGVAEVANPDGTFTVHKETAHLLITGHWFPDITAPQIEESIHVEGLLQQQGAGLACEQSKQDMDPFLAVLSTSHCSDEALFPLVVQDGESDTGPNPLVVEVLDDITVSAEITNRRALGNISRANADFVRTLVEEGHVIPEPRTAVLALAGVLAMALGARQRNMRHQNSWRKRKVVGELVDRFINDFFSANPK